MGQFEVEVSPITISYGEKSLFTETYGFVGSQGMVVLEGMYFLPKTKKSKTVILMMHPSSTLQQLPIPRALAESGIHLMCCGSRYPKNDSALIMEKVVLDLGEYIKYAKNKLGYETVVLLGWSGGGSLSLFYQAEAENPSIVDTPAGDLVDLVNVGLVPADAIMFIAAHASRALILTEWLDPSVKNELDPDDRDPVLDIYREGNSNKPPFSSKFIKEYREAQKLRNNKITNWVRDRLNHIKHVEDGQVEFGFVVHRTMADPRWIDPALEPNGRLPNKCYLGDPRAVNGGPAGLARFCTLRSWLSQWSLSESRADGITCAGKISVPFLAIENGADDACPPSHSKMIFEAVNSQNKERVFIAGAGHYYKGQPDKLDEAVFVITDWLGRNNLNDPVD